MRPALVVFALTFAIGAQAAPAILETCKACHDEDGSGVGKANVPIIAGIPAAHIEEALYAYKDGARRCELVPAMCETAAHWAAIDGLVFGTATANPRQPGYRRC